MKQITIHVSGGIAEITRQDAGTRVVIVDHDNDEGKGPSREVSAKPERGGDLSAAALLVHAFARGDAVEGRNIDWDDLGAAGKQARKELGARRCRAIEAMYEEEDEPA